jgi:hypothetical protein
MEQAYENGAFEALGQSKLQRNKTLRIYKAQLGDGENHKKLGCVPRREKVRISSILLHLE